MFEWESPPVSQDPTKIRVFCDIYYKQGATIASRGLVLFENLESPVLYCWLQLSELHFRSQVLEMYQSKKRPRFVSSAKATQTVCLCYLCLSAVETADIRFQEPKVHRAEIHSFTL